MSILDEKYDIGILRLGDLFEVSCGCSGDRLKWSLPQCNYWSFIYRQQFGEWIAHQPVIGSWQDTAEKSLCVAVVEMMKIKNDSGLQKSFNIIWSEHEGGRHCAKIKDETGSTYLKLILKQHNNEQISEFLTGHPLQHELG